MVQRLCSIVCGCRHKNHRHRSLTAGESASLSLTHTLEKAVWHVINVPSNSQKPAFFKLVESLVYKQLTEAGRVCCVRGSVSLEAFQFPCFQNVCLWRLSSSGSVMVLNLRVHACMCERLCSSELKCLCKWVFDYCDEPIEHVHAEGPCVCVRKIRATGVRVVVV